MKSHRRLLYIAGLVVLSTAAALHYFQKPKDKTIRDLAITQGHILSYSLLDDSQGKHQYTILLSEYPATFQIPSEFAAYFAKPYFEADLKKGDALSISIPVDSAAHLISTGTIPVFAVRTTRTTYLDEHPTLAKYNHEEKPNKPIQASIPWRAALMPAVSILILIALAFVIWKIARTIWKQSRQRKASLDPAALFESSQRLKKCLTKGVAGQKPLPMTEQKLLTLGDSDPELLATTDVESNSSEPANLKKATPHSR